MLLPTRPYYPHCARAWSRRRARAFRRATATLEVHSPSGVLDNSKMAAITANFPRQGADENCGLGLPAAVLFPSYVRSLLRGTTGARAATRSSASATPPVGVAVSLEILFGKYTEKIYPDPP